MGGVVQDRLPETVGGIVMLVLAVGAIRYNRLAAGGEAKSTKGKSVSQRLLEFIEHPLFLLVGSIIGGIVRVVYPPILSVTVVCVLLALHRSKAVADLALRTQALCYVVLFLVTAAGLFIIGKLVSVSANRFMNGVAHSVVTALRSTPSDSEQSVIKRSTLPKAEPVAPRAGALSTSLPATTAPIHKGPRYPTTQETDNKLSALLIKGNDVLDICKGGLTQECTRERGKWEKEVEDVLEPDRVRLAQWLSAVHQNQLGVPYPEIANEANVLSRIIDQSKPVPTSKRPCSERACVFQEEVNAFDADRHVEVAFKNTGSGPALNFRTRCQFLIADKSFDLSSLKEQNLAKPTSSGTLAAGVKGMTRVDSDAKTTQEIWEQIKDGTRLAFVYGQFEYKDGNDSYYSRFCVMWSKQYKNFITCPDNDFVNAQNP